MSFKEIIGHKNVITFLEKSVKNDQVSHAYLFYGSRHLGKETVARQFAETLLGKPVYNHPDFYFVKRGMDKKEEKMMTEISIEQMRGLERKLSLSSFLNSYKIAIIEEAGKMSLAAANSLLKTLEEPTPKTVIILLSENIAALPATIVSRCQTIKFLPVCEEKIYQYLVNGGANRDEALSLTKISWGRPGVALRFWESRHEGESAALGEYLKYAKEAIEVMRAETFNGRMKVFEKYLTKNKISENSSESLSGILSVWTSVLRDLALAKSGCPELISNQFFINDLKTTASRFEAGFFPKLHRQTEQAKKYLAENFNPRLVVENLMLSF